MTLFLEDKNDIRSAKQQFDSYKLPLQEKIAKKECLCIIKENKNLSPEKLSIEQKENKQVLVNLKQERLQIEEELRETSLLLFDTRNKEQENKKTKDDIISENLKMKIIIDELEKEKLELEKLNSLQLELEQKSEYILKKNKNFERLMKEIENKKYENIEIDNKIKKQNINDITKNMKENSNDYIISELRFIFLQKRKIIEKFLNCKIADPVEINNGFKFLVKNNKITCWIYIINNMFNNVEICGDCKVEKIYEVIEKSIRLNSPEFFISSISFD